MDQKSAEKVRSGDSDNPEYIDQTCWVPQGQEIVPAQILLNGYAISIGKRYTSTESPYIDRLLANGLIEAGHHHTALRLLNLFRMGTNKQGFAVMQLLTSGRGYDNSDFCPMTAYLQATRNLKLSHMLWIKSICGIVECTYLRLAHNADLLRDALERVQENFESLDEALKDCLDNKDLA